MVPERRVRPHRGAPGPARGVSAAGWQDPSDAARSPTSSGGRGSPRGTRWRPRVGSRRGGRASDDLPARDRAADGLPLGRRAGRGHPRRHRPGALRRPHGRQAARHAPHPVRLPARPAAGGVGQRVGAGGRTAAAPGSPRRSRPRARRPTARPGWARPAPRVLRSLAEDGPATTAELRERLPELGCAWRCRPGQDLRRELPGRPAGARHAGGHRRDRARCTTPATGGVSRPRWTLDRGLAGGAGGAGPARRGLPRAGRPVAAHLRARHRGRPGLVAGRDQGRRTPRAGRARRGRGGARPTAPASCCPTTSTTSPSRSRGPRCSRCSTRRRWAGSSAGSTSTPRTCPSSSTPTATAAPPPGGTAGWWGAGCRTTTAWSRWCCVTTWERRPAPRSTWRPSG